MYGFQLTVTPTADLQIISPVGHSLWLVALSLLVAIASGYATLLMTRQLESAGEVLGKAVWRWIGAICLGGGIWSMHFIGMLAFQARLPLEYSAPMTGLSLAAAVAASYLVMGVLASRKARLRHYAGASVIAGLGITAMHYTGMAAIRPPAIQFYHPGLATLSVAIAIGVSFVALVLARYLRHKQGARAQWLRGLAAVVMGLAISSMHYTGMWAMTLAVPADVEIPASVDFTIPTLIAVGIGAMSLVLIIAGVLGTLLEHRLLRQKSELATVSGKLNSAIHYDRVTQLLNGAGFLHSGQSLLEGVGTGSVKRTLFAVNIDHFRRINNSLGHEAGDAVLRMVARRIRGVLGERDVLARFSGDEFCALVHDDADTTPDAFAQHIQNQLSSPMQLEGTSIRLTASVGYAVYPADAGDMQALFTPAGLALSHTRTLGRNRSQRFHADLKRQAEKELHLEHDLRQALATGGLHVVYQPIVDAVRSRVSGLEALVRWTHPVHGAISPDQFIPIAEAHGFARELDLWVFRQACCDVTRLRQSAEHRHIRVAVNCSGTSLERADLTGEIIRIMQETGATPEALRLEVTENTLINNIGPAATTLRELKQLGLGLSIDDFGTGYSSLAYLRSLPVDLLKIDRSFIRDLPDSQSDRDITAGVIALARMLHLEIIAEGAENKAQLDFLVDNGCSLIQGYLFSAPLPFAELERWLGGQLWLDIHREHAIA